MSLRMRVIAASVAVVAVLAAVLVFWTMRSAPADPVSDGLYYCEQGEPIQGQCREFTGQESFSIYKCADNLPGVSTETYDSSTATCEFEATASACLYTDGSEVNGALLSGETCSTPVVYSHSIESCPVSFAATPTAEIYGPVQANRLCYRDLGPAQLEG